MKSLDLLAKVGLLPVAADQFRLVVPQVEMTGAAGHEQLDDSFGPRPVMQPTAQRLLFARRVRVCGQQTFFGQQRGKSNAPQPATELPEKLAS